MKYQGGKERVAQFIAPILNASVASGSGTFYSPMCGGLSVESRVVASRYVIGDIRADVVSMWEAAMTGWIPPDVVTEDMHRDIKRNPSQYASELVAFVMCACSFGGWYGAGFARSRRQDNFAKAGSRSVRRKVERLPNVGITWIAGDYRDTLKHVGAGDTVYCDPPYTGTLGYGMAFDSSAFWTYMQTLADRGASVFVSEQYCPVPHAIEWAKPKRLGIRSKTKTHLMEHLFRVLPITNPR